MSSQPSAPSGVGMLYGSGKRRAAVLSSMDVITVSSLVVSWLQMNWASCHDAAAVDEQYLTGDETAGRGKQEGHRPDDVIGMTDASERSGGRVIAVWVADCPLAFGIGETWCHRIDPNLVGPRLARQ